MRYYSTDTYTAQNSIGYLVRRASNLLTSRVETTFADFDVTFMQWVVLLHLRDNVAITAAEIGRSIGHDSGAMTRLVDNLAQRGLGGALSKQPGSQDRRTQPNRSGTPDGRGPGAACRRLPQSGRCSVYPRRGGYADAAFNQIIGWNFRGRDKVGRTGIGWS